jgi:hypothetical protein
LSFRDAPKQGFFGWLKSKVGIAPRPEAILKPGEQLAGGHRGRAFGDMSNPDLSIENVRTWRSVSPEEAEDYLNGELFLMNSTNVAAAQYHPETRQLMVEYNAKDGRGSRKYLYDDVSPMEMRLLIAASSKGSWTWTYLIGRNRGLPPRPPLKPYRRI